MTAPVAPRRVLVVDDDPDTVDCYRVLLELWGHHVATAAEGGVALAAASTFRPEVVLLNNGLPRMDGFEVVRRLRGLPEAAGAVLVALTGSVRDDVASTAAGFDHYLPKPVDPDELRRLVEASVPNSNP